VSYNVYMKCDFCREDIGKLSDKDYSTRHYLFEGRWIYTHLECEKKKESQEEIDRQSRIDERKVNIRDLDNNILHCNLCGLTSCKNINSCVVTSD
jgi:hypothetical protein